jgi:hypothetical protein
MTPSRTLWFQTSHRIMDNGVYAEDLPSTSRLVHSLCWHVTRLRENPFTQFRVINCMVERVVHKTTREVAARYRWKICHTDGRTEHIQKVFFAYIKAWRTSEAGVINPSSRLRPSDVFYATCLLFSNVCSVNRVKKSSSLFSENTSCC